MKDYARIENGTVFELFNIPAEFDIGNYPTEWLMIDVTVIDPQPRLGWIYDGVNFNEPSPPYIDPRPAILAELAEIDLASARHLRVIVITDPGIGSGTSERAELEALELRAAELRAQLEALPPPP